MAPGIAQYAEHLVLLAKLHASRAVRGYQMAHSANTPEGAQRYLRALRLENGNPSSHFRECDRLKDDGSPRGWSSEERAALAIELLDGDVPLSPALEAALWKLVLRLHKPDFTFPKSGLRFSRLDVAIYAFFLFGCAHPVPLGEQDAVLSSVPLDSDVLNGVFAGTRWQPFWVRSLKLAAPSSVFTEIPFDLALSDLNAVYSVRGATTAAHQRDPTYDAPLPTVEHTAKLAFIAASKAIYSFALPVAVTTHAPDPTALPLPRWESIRMTNVEVVRLLPSDVATTVDSAFKAKDAATVLSQLAHFANYERRNQLAVVLSQLAIARWRSCTKAWVTLHDALRALNAAVVLPTFDNELFNSSDCYLEAIKLERAGASNANPNPDTTRFDLGMRRQYDPSAESWKGFAVRVMTFATAGVVLSLALRLLERRGQRTCA